MKTKPHLEKIKVGVALFGYGQNGYIQNGDRQNEYIGIIVDRGRNVWYNESNKDDIVIIERNFVWKEKYYCLLLKIS